VSDALANDQNVCPTTQPFIPDWNTPRDAHYDIKQLLVDYQLVKVS